MVLKGHTLDIISLVLIFVLSRFVMPEHTRLLILIIFICILSRSNFVYHSVNLEIHSILMVFIAITYGFWPCFFIAIMSTWPAKSLSGWMGIYNPILTGMDTIHMVFVALFASLLSIHTYFIPAMLILFFAEFIREGFRFFTFHENFIKYTIMGTFFMIMFYLAMKNIPHIFINFIGG